MARVTANSKSGRRLAHAKGSQPSPDKPITLSPAQLTWNAQLIAKQQQKNLELLLDKGVEDIPL